MIHYLTNWVFQFQAADLEVPNYRFPDQILPGPDNKITLDRITGILEWITPQRKASIILHFLFMNIAMEYYYHHHPRYASDHRKLQR